MKNPSPTESNDDKRLKQLLHELDALSSTENAQEFKDLQLLKTLLVPKNQSKKPIISTKVEKTSQSPTISPDNNDSPVDDLSPDAKTTVSESISSDPLPEKKSNKKPSTSSPVENPSIDAPESPVITDNPITSENIPTTEKSDNSRFKLHSDQKSDTEEVETPYPKANPRIDNIEVPVVTDDEAPLAIIEKPKEAAEFSNNNDDSSFKLYSDEERAIDEIGDEPLAPATEVNADDLQALNALFGFNAPSAEENKTLTPEIITPSEINPESVNNSHDSNWDEGNDDEPIAETEVNENDLQDLNALFGFSSPSANSESSSTGEGLHELRDLLINPETERLNQLEQRLKQVADEIHTEVIAEISTKDIAGVLPQAIQSSDYEETNIALRSHVEECLTQSVHNNSQIFAEALFPVIGPAIQQSITKTLKNMLQSLNQTLEQGFSFRGLLWRFQSWRSGVPFREIVLRNTLTYRVEQVFLIHKETGLLLQHLCAEDIQEQRDSDAVSAMFTAIQDFINDSFSTSSSQQTLERVEIGENTVFLDHGRFAMLACVIRGIPPNSLRDIFESVVKEIHLRFQPLLENFEGDNSALDVTQTILERCLVSATEAPPLAFKRIFLLGLILISPLLYWGYQNYIFHQRADAYLQVLQQTEGIVVMDSVYEGNHLYLKGLHDPFAKNPVEIAQQFDLSADELSTEWENYQSLTPNIMLKRATQLLSPSENISLAIKGRVLYASGLSDSQWLNEFNNLGLFIPGIESVDSSGLQDYDQFLLSEVKAVLKAPDSVSLSVKDKVLILNGVAPLSWVQDVPQKLTAINDLKSYDNQLSNQEVLEFNQLRQTLEQQSFNFKQIQANGLPELKQFVALSQLLNQQTKLIISTADIKTAQPLLQYLQQQIPQQYAVIHKTTETSDVAQLKFKIETQSPEHYAQDLALTQTSLQLLQPPPSVYLQVENTVLTMSGIAALTWQQQTNQQLPQLKGLTAHRYVDFNLQEQLTLETLIAAIEDTEIYFEQQQQFALYQEEVFAQLEFQFKQLFQLSELLSRYTFVTLAGHTDSIGSMSVNQELAQQRAFITLKKLQQQGLDEKHFRVKMGDIESLENIQTEKHKRRVSFHIKSISKAVYEHDLALKQQLHQLLAPPKSVSLDVENAQLVLNGESQFAWFVEARKKLPSVTGLKNYHFQLSFTEDKLYQQLWAKLQTFSVRFNHQQTLTDEESLKLQRLAKDLHQLATLAQQMERTFKLNTTSYLLRKNSSYRKKAQTRAELIIQQLTQFGVDAQLFESIDYPLTTSIEQENKVTLNITQ